MVTSWNQGAQRIKGYTRDDIIGKHFSRFYLPEDVDTVMAAAFNKNLDPKAAWQLIRAEAIAGLAEVTLRLLD